MNYVKSIEKTRGVLGEILCERIGQDGKWGEQNWPNGTSNSDRDLYLADLAKTNCNRNVELGIVTWRDILEEEFFECCAENDNSKLRVELIQLAAVAVNWIEAIDRRKKK